MPRDQWTNYWRDGVSTSFGHQAPAWYKRTLVPYWERTFQVLPQGADILDVASGNGAVAAIAAKVSNEDGSSFHIVAADKAVLSPQVQKGSPLQEIEFVSGMPLEKLHFPGQSFDLVCSQFGIEYANMDKALEAVAGVLKSGGNLVIVAHHFDSTICKNSREEMRQYREMLRQQPLFEKLRTLVKAMGEIRSRSDLQRLAANPRSEKARQAFNRLVGKLMHKFPEGAVVADALVQINPLFKERAVAPVSAKLAYIEAIEQSFRLGQQRLTDLLNAALDRKRLDKLLASAESHGLQRVSTGNMEDEKAGLLAWVIKLER